MLTIIQTYILSLKYNKKAQHTWTVVAMVIVLIFLIAMLIFTNLMGSKIQGLVSTFNGGR